MNFDRAALVSHAHDTIARGSKSFAAASKLFDPITRERVWLLYAWCRACDDLADGQDLGGAAVETVTDPAAALAQIHKLTTKALAGAPSGDPSFDALAIVAAESGINAVHTGDIIAGFALDSMGWSPKTELEMLGYCYHVAGAVGVVMALVMGVLPDDSDTLDRACDLGVAFQLGNIARDIAEDTAISRCYLPQDWLAQAGIVPSEIMAPQHRAALMRMAARLAQIAEFYENSARIGAARLPFRSRWAVHSAAGIYGAISRKVVRAGSHAWDQRISTGKLAKLGHVLRALIKSALPVATNCTAVPYCRATLARATKSAFTA